MAQASKTNSQANTQARLIKEGWTVEEPSRAASIQRWLNKKTGLTIDAIRLTGNRFLILQDNTLPCCKIEHVKMRDYEYQCEYQRTDALTRDADLVVTTGTRADMWRDMKIAEQDAQVADAKPSLFYFQVAASHHGKNVQAQASFLAESGEAALTLFKSAFEDHVCRGFFQAKPHPQLWEGFTFAVKQADAPKSLEFVWDRLSNKMPVNGVHL